MLKIDNHKPDKHNAGWPAEITASLRCHCVAPSDDAIIHAYDRFCDELEAPFVESEHEMAGLYAEIVADVAALQALAPELVERALAKHAVELSYQIEHEGERR